MRSLAFLFFMVMAFSFISCKEKNDKNTETVTVEETKTDFDSVKNPIYNEG
ncbi:MAG: hypothetical protein R2771_12840 [Saprospiraceae bacterium]